MTEDFESSDDQTNSLKSGNKEYSKDAKNVKILIDKKIANINPLTNIVEPAFNKFTAKTIPKDLNNTLLGIKSLSTGRPEIATSKSQESTMQPKSETQFVKTISGIDQERFKQEQLQFVKDLEDQNKMSKNKEQEAKKGRKLRKEYTLPPKPTKGMAFYAMEMKKYEAAKYYLLNQNNTTLSKTCKKFKVSVPTLITYMDKDRVEAYLKTGKYSGTAARRERRNVKNQYGEKEQVGDKWADTLKTLLNDDASNDTSKSKDKKKTSLNDNRILFVQPEMSKRETLAASHLEESKKIMKDTQEKFQNLRSSKTQTRKISENKMSKQNSFENVNEASKLSLPPLKISKKSNSFKDIRKISPNFQKPTGSLMHLANLSSMYVNKPREGGSQWLGNSFLEAQCLTNQGSGLDRGYMTFSRPGSNYFSSTFGQNMGNGYKIPPLTAGSNIGYSGNELKNDLNCMGNQRMNLFNGNGISNHSSKNFPFLPINSKSSTLLSAGSILDPMETTYEKPNETGIDIQNETQKRLSNGMESYENSKTIRESNERLVSPKEESGMDASQKPIKKQYVEFGNSIERESKTSAGSFAFTPPNSGSTTKNDNQPEYF
ncbi:unnamed protein product [Hanseniaspora opuntiae]